MTRRRLRAAGVLLLIIWGSTPIAAIAFAVLAGYLLGTAVRKHRP